MIRAVISGFLIWLCTHAASAAPADKSPLAHLQAGRYDEARVALLPIIEGRRTQVLDAAHFEALILVHKKQRHAAIDAFRNILLIDPTYEPSRRELVFLLARNNEIEAAAFHAERLVGSTKNPRLAADLQKFIAASRLGPPNGAVLSFSIKPSTNINNGSTKDTILVGDLEFDIDEASRAKAGVGVTPGFSAWHRRSLNERWDVKLTGSANATFYPDQDIKTATVASVKLDFGRTLERGRFTFGPMVHGQFEGDKLSRRRVGATATIKKGLKRRREVSASLSAFEQMYPETDYRNGRLVRGDVSLKKIVSPVAMYKFTVPFEFEETQRSHLDHKGIGLSFQYDREWKAGVSAALVAKAYVDKYKGIYPSTETPREDRVFSVGVNLKTKKLRVGKSVPVFSYTYTRTQSNIALFDKYAHEFGVSFSKKF